jgi:hypothetical protein
MPKRARPRVLTTPPADRYAAPGERIIEYTFPDGDGGAGQPGGLISFSQLANGTRLVKLYGHDPAVVIQLQRPTPAVADATAPAQVSLPAVFRDPSEKQEEVWRVAFQGGILPVEFQSKGAAEIHHARCVEAGRALP